jgi:hypothetical protein
MNQASEDLGVSAYQPRTGKPDDLWNWRSGSNFPRKTHILRNWKRELAEGGAGRELTARRGGQIQPLVARWWPGGVRLQLDTRLGVGTMKAASWPSGWEGRILATWPFTADERLAADPCPLAWVIANCSPPHRQIPGVVGGVLRRLKSLN